MFQSTSELANRIPIEKHKSPVCEESETYDCDMCDSGGWTSETEIEVHKHMEHKQEMLHLLYQDSDELCEICLKKFDSSDDLKKHIKSEHLLSSEDAIRVERELFICDICQAFFFNKKQLAVHIVHCHINIKKIECARCNRTIPVKNLWFHYIHHNIQSVATCKICFLKCKDRKSLKEHILTHRKYFHCEICQYQTKKEDLFNNHIQLRHNRNFSNLPTYNNIDIYFYPTSYTKKLSRTSHFRGLMLSNDYRVCILCREIFNNLIKMQMHIYEHVMGNEIIEIKYQCMCGEVFSNKVLLKQHVFQLKGNHAPKH
ncbi:PR domain zinc finger protein 5 [Pieris rapae]|uniref:PR domain zinc finger protein 5 n=1 Tax=Pieris rapae TaxID=64459 RepID=UPI000B92C734|nr:PR domain zinc finger protein 5 [Pieris rapae]